MFPKSEVKRNNENWLTWTHLITPSPLSGTYKVLLKYAKNHGIEFYVIEPNPLELAKDITVLPHVYSTPKQQLCLYSPRNYEWNVGMLYVETIIPWACEWLYHYELWVSTGIWHGGGIVHETVAEKQANKQKEIINETMQPNKIK